MGKMSDTEKMLIIVVLFLGIVIMAQAGVFNKLFQEIAPSPPPGTEGEKAVGVFDIKVVGYNSLDITSTLTLGTNYACYVFGYRPGGWLMLGSFSNGVATVELTSQDNGYVYIVVEVPSGQQYYVDAATTKAQNPRVVSVLYEDPDNDGYKEFIFKFDMRNIPKPASGNPTIYFYPYFLAYQKPNINSPPDITGVGTARVTKYIEWYLSFANEKKAWAIVKIEISVNTTDTTKMTINRLNVAGYGVLTGDSFGAPIRGTNSLTWSATLGNNLLDAYFLKYGANQLNKFDFTFQADFQLASSDVLAVTLTIYGLGPNGVLETRTDTVLISAA